MSPAPPGWMETYRGRVSARECDHFGHMNVQFYVARISDATAALTGAMGLTAPYVREQQRALVTLRHEISYLAELHAGDLVVMHGAVLSVDGKKVRVVHRMQRVEDDEHVMNATALMIGMDLRRRKSLALDEDILARARSMIVDEANA